MFVGSEPPGPELAVRDERAAFALRAEAVVLERDEDGVRVAVVELEHVDVVERDAGHAQRELAGAPGAGVDGRLAPGALVVAGSGLAEAEQVHRRLAQVARALGRGDDDGDGAVRDQAAVEQVQRLDDPARRVVVVERHRPAVHLRVRVQLRPRALADRDRAELIVRRAVEVHVAPARERVARVRRPVVAVREAQAREAGRPADPAAVVGRL